MQARVALRFQEKLLPSPSARDVSSTSASIDADGTHVEVPRKVQAFVSSIPCRRVSLSAIAMVLVPDLVFLMFTF